MKMIKKGFLEIIYIYALDKIGILNSLNNPNKFGNIINVFKFLNKSEEFLIQYQLNRKCDICYFSLIIKEFYNSYIYIILI